MVTDRVAELEDVGGGLVTASLEDEVLPKVEVIQEEVMEEVAVPVASLLIDETTEDADVPVAQVDGLLLGEKVVDTVTVTDSITVCVVFELLEGPVTSDEADELAVTEGDVVTVTVEIVSTKVPLVVSDSVPNEVEDQAGGGDTGYVVGTVIWLLVLSETEELSLWLIVDWLAVVARVEEDPITLVLLEIDSVVVMVEVLPSLLAVEVKPEVLVVVVPLSSVVALLLAVPMVLVEFQT